jgi:hypothetical protein
MDHTRNEIYILRSSDVADFVDGKESQMSEDVSEQHAAAVREVEQSQREFSQALGDLEGVVRSSVDPMKWITDRPLLWVLGGLVLGFWFGTKR